MVLRIKYINSYDNVNNEKFDRGDVHMKGKKFYGTVEVARILGVAPLTVWRWCKEGKIKAGKTPGGQFRIPREEVERLLKQLRGE